MRFCLAAILLISFLMPAVETIHSEKPHHDSWSLQEKPIRTLRSYGSVPMYVPSVCAVSDDEKLVIYDWKHHENFIVDRSGNFIGRFGKRGEGPGEIGFQQQVLFASKILVLDSYRNAILSFCPEGRFLSSLRIDSQFGRAQRLADSDGYLSAPDTTPFTITHVNTKNGKIRQLVELADREGISFTLAKGEVQRLTLVIPALTPRILALYHPRSDSYYYGISNRFVIYQMDRFGLVKRRISIPKEPRYMTGKMHKELSREIHISEQMAKRIGGRLNFFSRIEIVDDLLLVYGMGFGDLWPVLELDIFSLDGRYLAHTVFNPGQDVRLHCTYNYSVEFRKDRMFAVLEDEDGMYRIVVYSVRLPSGQV